MWHSVWAILETAENRKPKAENWEERGVLFSQIPLAEANRSHVSDR